MKTKKVTITMTPDVKEIAETASKVAFGFSNISGYISMLIKSAGRMKDEIKNQKL